MTDRRARYETPERRHLKQIVFPNMEEAKAAADKLAQGTTFEALATERGLKDTDIDLGTVAKTAVVDRDVADAAFALKSGEVSAPVQGRFGIAIVKVDAIEAGQTRPFEEVAAELKRDMQNERAKNELTNVQEKIEDERLGGATLADAARKFNLKPRVHRGDRPQRQGCRRATPSPTCRRTSTCWPRRSAPTSTARTSRCGCRRTAAMSGSTSTAITPARDRPLDEVKDQVVARWRDDEIDDAAAGPRPPRCWTRSRPARRSTDAAAADKLKVEWRPGIKRGGPPAGLPAAAVTEIFKRRRMRPAASRARARPSGSCSA